MPITLWDDTISIHAPHEGERLSADDIRELEDIFQSTLPTRGSDKPAPVPYPVAV